MSTRYLALMIFTAVLSGCSTSQPHLYQGIASSAQMSVNSRESSQKTPFAFTGDMRITTASAWVSAEASCEPILITPAGKRLKR